MRGLFKISKDLFFYYSLCLIFSLVECLLVCFSCCAPFAHKSAQIDHPQFIDWLALIDENIIRDHFYLSAVYWLTYSLVQVKQLMFPFLRSTDRFEMPLSTVHILPRGWKAIYCRRQIKHSNSNSCIGLAILVFECCIYDKVGVAKNKKKNVLFYN